MTQDITVEQRHRDAAGRIVGEFRQEGWPAKQGEIANFLAAFEATITAEKDARIAELTRERDEVRELTKPWASYHGDLPDYDHPLRCVYESGIQYALELLAKTLSVEHYECCDGTEEFDGDLGGTLMNIVLAALPKDEHGDDIWPTDVDTRIADLTRERDEARRDLERDRSLVCVAKNGLEARFNQYAHLSEFGRGSYAWDGDRYVEEFGNALKYFREGLAPLQKISRDWSNCPTDQMEIAFARIDWQARALAAQQQAERYRGALEAILDATSVGQHHRPVNDRSAYGNYPAKLYHRARTTLTPKEAE